MNKFDPGQTKLQYHKNSIIDHLILACIKLIANFNDLAPRTP